MLLDFLPMYIRCSMSFSSSWLMHHVGIRYTKETLDDPLARLQMTQKQEDF